MSDNGQSVPQDYPLSACWPSSIATASIHANEVGAGVASAWIAASESFEQQHRHVRTPPTLLRAPARRRTTEIRGVARFIRPLPGSQSLFEGAKLTSCSRVPPRQSSSRASRRNARRRRIWRVQMRDQRRRRVGTEPHGQRRHRASVATFPRVPREPSRNRPACVESGATMREQSAGYYRTQAERLRLEAYLAEHESVRRQLIAVAADYEELPKRSSWSRSTCTQVAS